MLSKSRAFVFVAAAIAAVVGGYAAFLAAQTSKSGAGQRQA